MNHRFNQTIIAWDLGSCQTKHIHTHTSAWTFGGEVVAAGMGGSVFRVCV